MARSSKNKWIGLALVATAGLGAYELGFVGGAAQDGMKHLANQVWIERLPENDRDMIHHLVMVQEGRDRFGAFGKSSTWRHFVEIFMWQREDNRLTLHLPQDRVRVDLTARVWDCEGEAPEPFELCLELKGQNGRSARYYSRHEWTIDGELAPGMKDLVPAGSPQLPADVLFAEGDDAALLGR